jgi:hypothetical protein
MDFFNRRRSLGILFRVSKRIQDLQEYFKRKISSVSYSTLECYRKRLISGLFFSLSLILGFYAYRLTKSEGIEDWKRDHLPSEQIFRLALESHRAEQTFTVQSKAAGKKGQNWVRGIEKLIKIQNEMILEKTVRSIPLQSEERGSVWMSANGSWVVYFWIYEQIVKPQVYCWDCSSSGYDWQLAGIGWEGLENVLANGAFQVKKVTASSKRLEVRDPRELRF